MIKFDTIVLSDKEPERSDLWLKILQSDKVGEDGTTDMNISGLKLKYFSPRGWRSLLDWNTNMIYDFGYSKDTTEYTGDPITYSVSENKKTEHTDVVTNYWVFDGSREIGDYDNIVLEKGLKTVLEDYVTIDLFNSTLAGYVTLDIFNITLGDYVKVDVLEEYAKLEDLTESGVSNVSLSVINDTAESWYGTNNTDEGLEVYLYALSVEADEDALLTLSYLDAITWEGSTTSELYDDQSSTDLVTATSLYDVLDDALGSFIDLDFYDTEWAPALTGYVEDGLQKYHLNVWDGWYLDDAAESTENLSFALVPIRGLFEVLSDFTEISSEHAYTTTVGNDYSAPVEQYISHTAGWNEEGSIYYTEWNIYHPVIQVWGGTSVEDLEEAGGNKSNALVPVKALYYIYSEIMAKFDEIEERLDEIEGVMK